MQGNRGRLLIIGFGPGSEGNLTARAREAISESQVILGYKTYVDLVRDLLREDQVVMEAGMTEEVARAQEAIRIVLEGKTAGVISSGDAGVYGMAGLVYEVMAEKGLTEEDLLVEVIPGISAINSCASLLGAPIMHDACTISLSDHLTPWEVIARRVDAAAQSDFVIAFYNPKSGRRTRQIEEARRILLQYRSPQTPVGLVKSAYRDTQSVVVTDLENMLDHEIGMLTTVIVGNTSTFVYDGKIVTPRGYHRKYTLDREEQNLKLHERLKEEAEPWALHTVGRENGQENTTAYVKPTFTASFECLVSPGLANKTFTPAQWKTIGEVIGEHGRIEYTPHHGLLLTLSADSQTEEIVGKLRDAGLLVMPSGDVVLVKACDFCNGDKADPIPYGEEILARVGGLSVPKELRIGFNGCGMVCYGAVKEDIGIVYRRGKFDLFLGGKTAGREAYQAQLVAEGIEPELIVDLVEKIIRTYREEGHPGERFYKYLTRMGKIAGFSWKEPEGQAAFASNLPFPRD